jgi:putative ABC transport system ATP-binding protein
MDPVQLRGVGYAYGEGELRRPVLRDVDLTVREGEIVLLTGPSGSGKTTLLTLIGALRGLQEGSARVLGEELMGRLRARASGCASASASSSRTTTCWAS